MLATEQSRVFLVVVDETEEHRLAVHYAARRAAHTGGKLALLYVIEPAELQQWLAIEELARAERPGAHRRRPDNFDPGARRRDRRRRPRPARVVSDRKGGCSSAHPDHDRAWRAKPRRCRGAELTGLAFRPPRR